MTVPYAKFDDWEMNATLFQGTIFIEENHGKKLASRQEHAEHGQGLGLLGKRSMLKAAPATSSSTHGEAFYLTNLMTWILLDTPQLVSVMMFRGQGRRIILRL